MLNATNDYTEKDKALDKYRELEAKAFRRECYRVAKKTGKMAFKDGAFLVAVGLFIITTIVVVINIFI